ncbi:beta-glucosidase [Cryptosporangium japonicum]|uniref:Glycoside hydrolase family 3 C-terminal domain-containing protein n=1 Tax=Cryptosporangium japonicum TaxID=80872 RepID=A0ABN0UF89_9ACTN
MTDPLVDKLDLDAKARLTAGRTGWSTEDATAVGLAPVILCDGPLGLVSPTMDERDRSLLLPCGAAVAATWDPAVARALGQVLGAEAVGRGVHGVYSPNLNLPRTGLSGRSFEMYSEDPELTGVLGVAFALGLQSQGVASVVKHLVANDTETARQTMSATLDEVTLREVYLRPFELAVRAGVWGLMTAYNAVNGVPNAEHAQILAIVREEWGFDGLVVSDYYALKRTIEPFLAGTDLEMPGPAIWYGPKIADAVRAGQVPEERLDAAVDRLLRLGARTGALAGGPVVLTEPAPAPTPTLHDAAVASFVLLANDGVLPLAPGRSLAVIGPNAARPTYQGATFGRIHPFDGVATPLDAVRARFGTVVHAPGTAQPEAGPLTGPGVTTPDGRPGLLVEHWRRGEDTPALADVRQSSLFTWFGAVPGVGPTPEIDRVRLSATVTPDLSGVHRLTIGGSGALTLTVDGAHLLDRPAPAPQDLMGAVARSETSGVDVALTAGVPVSVVVDMACTEGRVIALTAGILPPQPGDALADAVAAATTADDVVLVVGDTITATRESRDRETSALPDDQVALIRAVAAVNPRTVVVVNAGRPVDLSWADDVAAVLCAWLPGQGFGTALAAVLAGDREPGGRLPVSIPFADADRPTFGQHLDENSALDYTASEPSGYRGLEHAGTAPRFGLGAGLGYTRFRREDHAVHPTGDGGAVAGVRVTNVGTRPGKEVLQAYVRGPGETWSRLAGFTAVELQPGETRLVRVALPADAFRRWGPGWHVPAGTHTVRLGTSSTAIDVDVTIER